MKSKQFERKGTPSNKWVRNWLNQDVDSLFSSHTRYIGLFASSFATKTKTTWVTVLTRRDKFAS